MKESLTQDELKQLLRYNPETGLFTRVKKSANGRAKVGDIAGGYDLNGYNTIKLNGSRYYGHRLVWLYVYGYFPKEIDHIDRNKSNNKLSNLRSVTRKENMLNKPSYLGEYRGIWFNKKWNNHQVYARIDGKAIYCGSFKTKDEAMRARNMVEENYGKI